MEFSAFHSAKPENPQCRRFEDVPSRKFLLVPTASRFSTSKSKRKSRLLWAAILCIVVVCSAVFQWDGLVAIPRDRIGRAYTMCSVRRVMGSDSVEVPQELDSSVNFTSSQMRFKGTSRHLPAVIIIGAKKCGTRALLEMMNLHPKVRRTTREVHFFDRDANYAKGLTWYRKRMPFSFPDQLTVEKTPGYFVSSEAPVRIRAMNETVRLLLIVRDPVTRLISDYTQLVMSRDEEEADDFRPRFEDMVFDADGEVDTSYKPVRTSVYADFFPLWTEHFPRRQIHVVDGENLIVDPLSEMRRVEKFLELEPHINAGNFWFSEEKGFFCLRYDSLGKCLGPSKGRKHPAVPEHVKRRLRDFYRPHNAAFAKLANVSFDWLFR